MLDGSGCRIGQMWEELMKLKWDKKYCDTRRGKVLNKRARYNGENGRESKMEEKKGTIVV